MDRWYVEVTLASSLRGIRPSRPDTMIKELAGSLLAAQARCPRHSRDELELLPVPIGPDGFLLKGRLRVEG